MTNLKELKNGKYEKIADKNIRLVREGYFDTNTGRKHGTNPANQIKSSQLRNLYQLISSFFDLFTYGKQLIIDESKKILIRAKVKIAYQIGRDAKKEIGVWVFNHYTNILDLIDEILNSKNDEFENNLRDYCNYFEALVAYHKFYGIGGDK